MQTAEQKRAYFHAYYLKHREKKCAQAKAWYRNHPAQVAESRRRWARAHPELLKRYNRGRRREQPTTMRAYQQRYQQKVAAFLTWLKTDQPCVDCGGRFPPCAMDFDHVDPRGKEGNVGRVRGPVERLQAEIVKCELVCANCHRVRTFINRRKAVEALAR